MKQGDRIKIHGFVMLNRIDAGCTYEVTGVLNGAYHFAKVNKNGSLSKRGRVGHLIKDVDLWVGGNDNNRIDLIS